MQTAADDAVSSLNGTPDTRVHTLGILSLALISRSLVVWFAAVQFPHNWLYSRGIELGTLAHSLVVGEGLSSPFGGSTGPTALLGPGYPALIAIFFFVFGSFTFAAAIGVMALQLLFSVATVLVIMLVARRCFGVRAANVAGAFWALSLPLLWMPTIFWETCLSTLILVGMIGLALRSERHPTSILWVMMGAYCGLAGLVNPALLPALLGILGWAAWRVRKTSRYSPTLSLIVLLFVFGPWPIRNARMLHAFIPLRSTVGFELWTGNHAGASGFLDESQFPIFNKREFDSYVTKGEVAYMQEKTDLARTYIYAHPIDFVRLSTLRFIRYWSGTGNKEGASIFAVHALLTTCLGFIGMLRLLRKRRFELAALFIVPLALFPLPYYITHAEFRYRLVVDPLLTILAAHALSDPIACFRKHADTMVSQRSCV